MQGRGLRLAVFAAMFIWVGAAFGAPAGNPVRGSFSGNYKVTFKITNTKSTATHWIYGAQPRCASLCHAVTFRDRLVSEKVWRKTAQTYRWNGKVYVLAKVLPKDANCVGKSGATVKKGYDIHSRYTFNVRTVTNGHVTQWKGTGIDKYVPNAAGKKKQCTAGAYVFSINATAP